MKDVIREQYKSKVSQARNLAGFAVPREGWVRTVRKALGMSGPQLARMLGLSRSQVTQMERMEAEDRITLKQLRRAAEALNCDLVYALVPREPIEALIQRRARTVAAALVGRADTHMKLESQQLSAAELEKEIEKEAERLVREMPRELWEE